MHAVCPHCQLPGDLTEVVDRDLGRVLRCPNERCPFRDVPILYADEYADHPPCQVSVIGLSGHGKTVYIDAVLQEITRIGGQWTGSGFNQVWLDQAQLARARKRIRDLRAGLLPKLTKPVLERPLIVRLSNVPRVGGSQLVLFDTGGEAFRSTEMLADGGRYVVHSPAVVWLLSLNPNEPEPGSEYAHQMLNVYLLGMAQLGGRPREQDLVITLTKGDELLTRPDLPKAARDALYAPSYNPAGGIWGTLDAASDELKRWLAEDCGYHDLVNLADARFRSVRYCITSSQGAPAGDDRQLDFRPMPRGVLAPLLWLWRLARPPAWVGTDMYLDLPGAVAAAPDGATVRLDAGTFRLPAPFALSRPVTLAGAGADRTVLETTSPDIGLEVYSDGRVTLRDLTVRNAAAGPADVVRVTGGELALDAVTVTGGRSSKLVNGIRKTAGAGVTVRSGASAVVTGGTIGRNAGSGLKFVGSGGGSATGTTFHHNGGGGVVAHTTGSVTVVRCTCRSNQTGVHLERLGSCLVDETVCEANKTSGIAVCKGAAPTVTGTVCSGNRGHGVLVTDASPALEQLTATGNAGCGVLFEGSAAGVARKTTARGNGGDGVRVTGTGPLKLEQTEATKNDGYGMVVTDPAAAVDLGLKGSTLNGNVAGNVSDVRPRGWFGGRS